MKEHTKYRKYKSEVLPGLEPGSPGSKPGVLTNYTIEPCIKESEGREKKTKKVIRSRFVRVILAQGPC